MPSMPLMPSTPQQDSPDTYDVVIVGGAFAGSGFATLLKRRLPDASVLVVESSERFERKVGEATVEVSGYFLHRVLGLWDHLARHHLSKHGLRYWFTDGPGRRLSEMTEIGSDEIPRLPSFQLDRSRLDEHLLATAAGEGCCVMRPARVVAVDHDWPASRVRVEDAAGQRQVTARWVIDASGRHAFLARRQKLLRRVEEHPTAAAWARWNGVADLDGPAFQSRVPGSDGLPPLVPSRRLATNHFCDYGWWCWVIPLAGGQTSIGLVYNKELFELPGAGSPRQRYERFLRSRSGLAELLAGAEIDGDDFMAYRHLPYKTSRYIDRGWALIGDAAAFLDPYYSAGLDHTAISIYATAQLVERDLAGRFSGDDFEVAMARHNKEFLRSYDRWLAALYLGKYELMGDAELLGCAFQVETAFYHLGVVTPVYRDPAALSVPIFGGFQPQSTVAFLLARAFNRRLRSLARRRRRSGIYGRRNVGYRRYSSAFGLGRGSLGPLFEGLATWLRLELETLLRLPRGGRVAAPKGVAEPERG